MKTAAYALALTVLAGLSGEASAACSGPTKSITGPNGIPRIVCLDGKYSTCVRDSQSAGWSYQQAKDYCDGRRKLGKIK
jgi:hypothetical protein